MPSQLWRLEYHGGEEAVEEVRSTRLLWECPAIPVQVVLVLLVKSPYPKVFLMAAIMEAMLRSVMT